MTPTHKPDDAPKGWQVRWVRGGQRYVCDFDRERHAEFFRDGLKEGGATEIELLEFLGTLPKTGVKR